MRTLNEMRPRRHAAWVAAMACVIVCFMSSSSCGDDVLADDIGQQPKTTTWSFDSTKFYDRLAVNMVTVLDAYLDFLAKPETAEKLAAFQMNYYKALVAQGFTEEQAFQLVRDVGNPMARFAGQGK